MPAWAGAGIPSLQPCHLTYGVNRRKKPEEERSILTFCLVSSSAPVLLDPYSGPLSPGLGLSPHLIQFCQKEGYVSPKAVRAHRAVGQPAASLALPKFSLLPPHGHFPSQAQLPRCPAGVNPNCSAHGVGSLQDNLLSL